MLSIVSIQKIREFIQIYYDEFKYFRSSLTDIYADLRSYHYKIDFETIHRVFTTQNSHIYEIGKEKIIIFLYFMKCKKSPLTNRIKITANDFALFFEKHPFMCPGNDKIFCEINENVSFEKHESDYQQFQKGDMIWAEENEFVLQLAQENKIKIIIQ